MKKWILILILLISCGCTKKMEYEINDYVTTYYEERKVFEESEHDINVFEYQIPQFKMNSEEVKQVNQEIIDIFYDDLNEEEMIDIKYQNVKYYSSIHDDLLSLKIEAQNNHFLAIGNTYQVYTYDLKEGCLIKQKEVLNKIKMDEDGFKQKAKQAIGSLLWSQWDQDDDNFKYQAFCDLFNQAYDLSMDDENIAQAKLYLNDRNELCMIVDIYAMANAGIYQYDLNLDNFELIEGWDQRASVN